MLRAIEKRLNAAIKEFTPDANKQEFSFRFLHSLNLIMLIKLNTIDCKTLIKMKT